VELKYFLENQNYLMDNSFKNIRARFMACTGRIKLGTLLGLLTAAGAIYLAVLLVPPWIDYFTFKSVMSEKAKDGNKLTNEEILKDLNASAKELNIPMEEKSVRINRQETQMSISAEWDDEINFIGDYGLVLHFSPEVTEQFR
jgi:hypothetical protein